VADHSMPPEFPDAPDVAPLGHPDPPNDPLVVRRNPAANAALPWLLAVLVVLLLAASGGLVTAWIVANLRAVPVPPVAGTTPTPSLAPFVTATPSAAPSAAGSEQPRHTPTPTPVRTPEPEPFVHIVLRGETLTYIADLYGVELADILAFNDIRNPDNIHPDQEILIPGYGTRPSPAPG
jgi:LysM repeat protein